jgi:hypothetical protein
MLTLKFYTAIGNKEVHQTVQVEGHVIERNVKTNEITVYGTNDRGERVPSQIWAMSYLHEGELVLCRGCVYVMNESGKTIDKYDISDWLIFHENVERRAARKGRENAA